MKARRKPLSAATAAAAMLASPLAFGPASAPTPGAIAVDGVVKARSACPIDETIARIRDDSAKKGILFFFAVGRQLLAANAGVELLPSMLLTFGNPARGSQFITAKGEAGLDWPVRLLVPRDADGDVRAICTDFGDIARRHGITTRDVQFATANGVVASIASAVRPN